MPEKSDLQIRFPEARISPSKTSRGSDDVRVIAFHLPQFHPIPENDRWWGKGFTEWTNVTRARPLFAGHHQPQLPTDLGFYDLRLPEVRAAQAELARQSGVEGFCYYYYWFAGKRLLERPLDEMLQSGQPDFPFCLCWANENWTRRWDGQENEILIAQEHSPEMNRAFAESVLPYLRDPRYIRIHGRPLLVVYRAALLPNLRETVAQWREVFRAHGIGEVHISAVLSFGFEAPAEHGFDSGIEFPPQSLTLQMVHPATVGATNFVGRLFDYEQEVVDAIGKPHRGGTTFPCVMPGWDNTARRKQSSLVFLNSNPGTYEFWLRSAVETARARLHGDERLVFVNAWNEWAEGTHLEPDDRNGHAFLAATRNVVEGKPDWKTAARMLRFRPGQDNAMALIEEILSANPDPLALKAVCAQDTLEMGEVTPLTNDENLAFRLEAFSPGRVSLGTSLRVSGWALARPRPVTAIVVQIGEDTLARIPLDIPWYDGHILIQGFPECGFPAFAGQIELSSRIAADAQAPLSLRLQAVLEDGTMIPLMQAQVRRVRLGWLSSLKDCAETRELRKRLSH